MICNVSVLLVSICWTMHPLCTHVLLSSMAHTASVQFLLKNGARSSTPHYIYGVNCLFCLLCVYCMSIAYVNACSYRQTDTARLQNPIPYSASYFGHKLHIDQNEKLGMYGVTHICAVDGFSGRIVAFALMPMKNNVEIYKHIFRSYLSV